MKRFTSLAAASALLFTVAACAGSGSSSSTTTAPGAASTTTNVSTTTSAVSADAPKAIISLSPTGTEMLFAIGAGSQVIAVDDQSNFPAEALQKPHKLSGFEPNVEAIAAMKPDLVVMSDSKVKDQLTSLGIKVWIGSAPDDFKGVYDQIEQLGAATGHVADAAGVVSKMQTDIAAAVNGVTASATPLRVYHELDPTFYSVTSKTFIGAVYSLFGMNNIADGAQPGNDYPQLNAEYIVKANPDLVVLADSKCCSANATSVAARPGWSAVNAVAHQGLVLVDDDVASRWGPRLVDFVKVVAAAAAKVPVGA
ncbi:MAG: ABC transporter substrate-binding protein [Actinomycetota bacterium]